VRDLEREGDRTPGVYRLSGVTIAQSAHLPPDAISVSGYMTELVSFINRSDLPKYDLMKIALAHHRFGWIHPFSNGNGRVVRLLTFALLVKYGFNVQKYGRVLNPTAVFCNDRELYYSMLAQADTGKTEGLERWCTYVLQGILQELRKVDQLTNFSYLRGKILEPAIAYAKERQLITSVEAQILLRTTRNGTVKSADLVEQMPALNANQRTYQIRRLIKQGMLLPVQAGARIYSAGFANSFLIRGVIQALFVEKFIPDSLVRP
jgi:Fic family protein